MAVTVNLADVGARVRSNGLDAHVFADQLFVSLPCSREQLVLSPGRSVKSPRLFWQQRTDIGAATGKSGHLPWPAAGDIDMLVQFVLRHAYSTSEYGPQYRPVLDALHRHGLTGQLCPAQGGGYYIKVPLHADGFLLVGSPDALPPRLDQVTGWRTEHFVDDTSVTVVYDSVPDGPDVERPRTGGADVNRLAASLARYVRELMVRYDGTSPLHAAIPGESGHDTLGWLFEELAALPPVFASASSDGTAVITIAAPDGSDATTVTLPTASVNRMNHLLLAEIAAHHALVR
ncbi:hypothetical protein SAMN05216251_12712 [Actinacidiphila alni]|uniref:Uncharacterized protein n=1 Tax=Actinacidiphila alni TaxID=380248 RepID=A0A1I2LBM7_9ACTN|nr:hypothetical protein [Actinacidiphila alni]SFF74601.1 hypothetical protein SAMN05216251_12712 [Actinacidiphila alni]